MMIACKKYTVLKKPSCKVSTFPIRPLPSNKPPSSTKPPGLNGGLRVRHGDIMVEYIWNAYC